MRSSMQIALVLGILLLPFAVGRHFQFQSENTPRLSQIEETQGVPLVKNNINPKMHGPHTKKNTGKQILQAAGSTIPDCTHACGPCIPCKRVTVIFKCSIAESCPIAYRCMCKGKAFPIPSYHSKP
eukprot:Gb_38060 [translate_table: standard]